jgi:hypothetical protein
LSRIFPTADVMKNGHALRSFLLGFPVRLSIPQAIGDWKHFPDSVLKSNVNTTFMWG